VAQRAAAPPAPRNVKRVLLVEDDRSTADYVARGLKQNGYVVDHVADGRNGLFHALDGSYSVIILDRMLPELDGLSILSAIRTAHIETPVIILSALGSTSERVRGLKGGSDDYLVKPFAFSELLARIEALERRSTRLPEPGQTVLTAGDLSVDLMSHQVERNGQRIELQPREFRLLAFLLANKGQVVTRTMMLEEVWEYHFDPHTNVIDALISRLRKKVDLPGLKPLIRTLRGVGYVLGDGD
jgi:two-component system, OmpR family, response regulator